MAKQDKHKVNEVTPPVIPPAAVPPSAVGQVTVETTQPSGETQVATVPASQVRADPKVNWNSLTGETPRPAKPARTTKRAQRQAIQTQRIERRQELRSARPAPTPRPEPQDETRTVELTLPESTWQRFDKHLARSRQDAAAFLRRILASQFR